MPIVDVSLQLCVSRPALLPEAVRGKSLAGSFSCDRVRAKHRYALIRRCGLLSRTYQWSANNVLIVRRRTRPRHVAYEYDMDKTSYADSVPNEGLAVVSMSVLKNAPLSTRSCGGSMFQIHSSSISSSTFVNYLLSQMLHDAVWSVLWSALGLERPVLQQVFDLVVTFVRCCLAELKQCQEHQC